MEGTTQTTYPGGCIPSLLINGSLTDAECYLLLRMHSQIQKSYHVEELKVLTGYKHQKIYKTLKGLAKNKLLLKDIEYKEGYRSIVRYKINVDLLYEKQQVSGDLFAEKQHISKNLNVEKQHISKNEAAHLHVKKQHISDDLRVEKQQESDLRVEKQQSIYITLSLYNKNKIKEREIGQVVHKVPNDPNWQHKAGFACRLYEMFYTAVDFHGILVEDGIVDNGEDPYLEKSVYHDCVHLYEKLHQVVKKTEGKDAVVTEEKVYALWSKLLYDYPKQVEPKIIAEDSKYFQIKTFVKNAKAYLNSLQQSKKPKTARIPKSKIPANQTALMQADIKDAHAAQQQPDKSIEDLLLQQYEHVLTYSHVEWEIAPKMPVLVVYLRQLWKEKHKLSVSRFLPESCMQENKKYERAKECTRFVNEVLTSWKEQQLETSDLKRFLACHKFAYVQQQESPAAPAADSKTDAIKLQRFKQKVMEGGLQVGNGV